MHTLNSIITGNPYEAAALITPYWLKHRIIALHGSMGAGKTTLVSNLLKTIDNTHVSASSPTFSLVNVYQGSETIYHFDLYRLTDADEAQRAGLIEMMFEGNLCVVEWPEIISHVLPDDVLHVSIDMTESDLTRKYIIKIADHE